MFYQKLNKILTIVFIASLVLYAFSYFKKDILPPPSDMAKILYEEPVQESFQSEAFTQEFDDKKYNITPLYEYELYGLIVTMRDLDETWYNIYYDSDPYNIKDVCVIWGSNLVKDYYQKVEYWSAIWTCHYRYQYADVPFFNHSALSNNHLLPASEKVSEKIKKAKPGDQIHIKGFLVNYEIAGREGVRTTSTTREDRGQGACEVIYVKEFDILKAANPIWRFIHGLCFWLVLLSFLGKGYVYIFT